MNRSLAPHVLASAAALVIGCSAPETPVPTVRQRPEHRGAPEQQAAAQQLQLPVVETNSIGMPLVLIPAGVFWRGSSDNDIRSRFALEDEGPHHRVRITRPFLLGRCEVTVGQFRRFVAAQAYVTDAERGGRGGFGWEGRKLVMKPEFTWRNTGFDQTDDHPVVNVSWHDAVAFCQWLSLQEGRAYRLPTEAEWEYACRAGSRTRYAFGYDEADMAAHAWFDANASVTTHPVGEKRANAWGLYDMHGNAYEWCADGFGPYAQSETPVDDPTGLPAGAYRVYRGGSYSTPASQCRSAFRLRSQPRNCSGNLGFRVACEQRGGSPFSRQAGGEAQDPAGR